MVRHACIATLIAALIAIPAAGRDNAMRGHLAALSAVGDTIPRDGLILEYLFATGATTNDTSGSGNHLILANSATAAGGILDLTGSSTAYAYTAANIPSGMTNIAYSVWLKGSDANANWIGGVNAPHETPGFVSTDIMYRPDLTPAQFIFLQYNAGNSDYDLRRATNNLPVATDWHHLVCQWSAGGEMSVHINGKVTTGPQTSLGARPTTVVANRLRLGTTAVTGVTTRFYRGHQARWRVYNRPGAGVPILSDADIAALYDEGPP